MTRKPSVRLEATRAGKWFREGYSNGIGPGESASSVSSGPISLRGFDYELATIRRPRRRLRRLVGIIAASHIARAVARPESVRCMFATEVPHAASEAATHVHAAAKASHVATAAEATAATSCLGRAREQGRGQQGG